MIEHFHKESITSHSNGVVNCRNDVMMWHRISIIEYSIHCFIWGRIKDMWTGLVTFISQGNISPNISFTLSFYLFHWILCFLFFFSNCFSIFPHIPFSTSIFPCNILRILKTNREQVKCRKRPISLSILREGGRSPERILFSLTF